MSSPKSKVKFINYSPIILTDILYPLGSTESSHLPNSYNDSAAKNSTNDSMDASEVFNSYQYSSETCHWESLFCNQFAYLTSSSIAKCHY